MPHAAREGAIHRLIGLGGGLIFVASLVYFAVCYGWRFDTPPRQSGDAVINIVVDLVLFSLFALHHSLFARASWKTWVRAHIAPSLERSVYVWIASALFIATCAWWQPVPGSFWHLSGLSARLLSVGQLSGGLFCVLSARRLDVFDLAGMRQAFGALPSSDLPRLDISGPYGFVRHPIYFGWLLVVWLAPWMNGTRLVFAAVSTFYLVLAIPFEERSLINVFGSAYSDYRRQVRWRMLPGIF